MTSGSQSDICGEVDARQDGPAQLRGHHLDAEVEEDARATDLLDTEPS